MEHDARNNGQRLSIACVTSFDPQTHGKNSWSHTVYHMCQILRGGGFDIAFLGPMHARVERAAGKLVDMSRRVVSRKRYMYFHSIWVSRRFGRVATRRLADAEAPFDLVLASGAVDVAFLKTDLPIVLILDATHMLMREYYPAYTNLSPRSRRELDTIERLAIQRAALILVSSSWAACSVIADYQAAADRVHVIPFGADLESAPAASILASRRRTDICRLLFLGSDWQRKGGDLAVETLLEIERRGVDAELVVCGCAPPRGVTHPHLRVIPFLNKRDPQQREALEALYLNSDFLLLPTRSDCAPMVFCEAAAFGLPAVTTDTGGVAEIVKHGETGFTLPHSARGDAYADLIARAYRNPVRYAELSVASRARYDERLNWDAWMRDAAPLIGAVARRQTLFGVQSVSQPQPANG
jgi:glycosyltransferase involved in cell wall biosynthesis